jgi:sulfite reductase alpha subunit-like flavoprotein
LVLLTDSTYRADGEFLPWALDLRSHILQKYPLPNGLFPIPDDELLPPKWILDFEESTEEAYIPAQTPDSSSWPSTARPLAMDDAIQNDMCLKDHPPKGLLESKEITLPPPDLLPIPNAIPAIVKSNLRLTPNDHWQDVRHIKLWLDDFPSYQPGDIITIYPKNFPEDVEGLIRLMDWTDVADKPLVFRTTATSNLIETSIPPIAHLYPVPKPTLRSLLTHNLDITAIPRRFFFEVISKFTEDPMHRQRLLEFTNPAFTDEFFDYTSRPRRSMLEVLHDFPSVRIPWKFVPYIFPVLRGRQFSIASGGRSKYSGDKSTEVEICVALVKYQTVLRKIRQGVCSRYLASLASGTVINVSLQAGTFRFDSDDAQSPVLMIAPGTGVAPMRSLIWERALFAEIWQRNRDPEKKRLVPGKAVLIFGGRNYTKDYLFGNEWKCPTLDVQVFTAFSRDQKEKRYVQDVIREKARLVYDMLVKQDATVYICGSSGKMPIAVRQALLDAFVEGGRVEDWNFTEQHAEEVLLSMEREGRYVQETW